VPEKNREGVSFLLTLVRVGPEELARMSPRAFGDWSAQSIKLLPEKDKLLESDASHQPYIPASKFEGVQGSSGSTPDTGGASL
jgi:hypothetical protein